MTSDSFVVTESMNLWRLLDFAFGKINTQTQTHLLDLIAQKTINVKGFSNLSSKHLGVICEMTQQICGHVVFEDVTSNFVEQKCDQNLK